jgi:threonine dehydrogenase-like Zn-dependent dehydrogenase
MKAIVFDGALKFVDDYAVPEPGEQDALVRVNMAGICNTDVEITKGYLGFHGVVGHEFVGIVEKAPENANGLIHRRVVGEINNGCNTCDYCKAGLQKHCPSRTTLGIQGRDGVLAEYATLPVSNLYAIPDSLSDEDAVFTEPVAAAYEIQEQIEIKPADSILVLGDGKLGLLCALVLNLSGVLVTMAGKHDKKLKIAGNQQIQTVNIATEKPGRERKYDIVIEATGSAEGFETALQYVKPRGIIVLKSTIASSQKINLAPLVIDEITLIGSCCGPFETAIEALAQKKIDIRPLISGIYTIENAGKAFEAAMKKESLKIIIDFR